VPDTPPPVTAQSALAVPVRGPVRVTVKVKAVLPEAPSAFCADSRTIDSVPVPGVSSFQISPVALAVPISTPADAPDRVTVKLSFNSAVVSPTTPMVMVLLVSPAAKLTTPEGKAPRAKSEADGFPVEATPPAVVVHFAEAWPAMLPVRVTRKVKGVVPACPSAREA